MDNYLRGVVPNEMPVSFGLEALKAQSVAARNYAYNANISPNYDVSDSTASQVYYGVNSYKEITDNAVLKTKGIFALYKNKPITALYFSTSPGITDDWDDVFADGFNAGIHPYLKPKYDYKEQKPLKSENDIEEFYSKTDNGFDINSPKFRWNIEFTKEELEKVLSQTLVQQSNAGLVSPKYDGAVPITGLKEIKPLKRTQSGKITELLISTNNGDFKVKKELGIRRVLKKNNAMLPSSNFYVKTKCNNITHKMLGLFDVDVQEPDVFTFSGGGFGHGVGMSQFGAYSMAKAGKKYPEILHHYYTDIELSTIPKTVLFNDYNVHYNTEFYYEPNMFKEIFLFINNQKNASEFNFMINDIEFNNTSEFAGNKLIKINIIPYLKEGINTISFKPLTINNKGKTVIYQVEFVNGK
jgi:peptidoglycan hydrolase-like amidase